jgi:hypothetical protein
LPSGRRTFGLYTFEQEEEYRRHKALHDIRQAIENAIAKQSRPQRKTRQERRDERLRQLEEKRARDWGVIVELLQYGPIVGVEDIVITEISKALGWSYKDTKLYLTRLSRQDSILQEDMAVRLLEVRLPDQVSRLRSVRTALMGVAGSDPEERDLELEQLRRELDLATRSVDWYRHKVEQLISSKAAALAANDREIARLTAQLDQAQTGPAPQPSKVEEVLRGALADANNQYDVLAHEYNDAFERWDGDARTMLREIDRLRTLSDGQAEEVERLTERLAAVSVKADSGD